MTDEALFAFALWCRQNDRKFIDDPVVLRRVFNAYDGIDEVEVVGEPALEKS